MGAYKIEIRRRNAEKILLAAEKAFIEESYAGTSMGNVAEEAKLPHSNPHYYFSTKDELYRDVLPGLLEVWKQGAPCFEMFDDPRVVSTSYIRVEMNHSRTHPHGSGAWANEVMHGVSLLGATLDDSLYEWVKMKEAKIHQRVGGKRIPSIEPSSLFYMTWASAQHYAGFSYQVKVPNGHQPLSDVQFERAVQTVTSVILREVGLGP